jgi:hypothetical protein
MKSTHGYHGQQNSIVNLQYQQKDIQNMILPSKMMRNLLFFRCLSIIVTYCQYSAIKKFYNENSESVIKMAANE